MISLTINIIFFLSKPFVNSRYFLSPSLSTISFFTFFVAVAVSAKIGKFFIFCSSLKNQAIFR